MRLAQQVKDWSWVKRLRKTMRYSRLRALFGPCDGVPRYIDDSAVVSRCAPPVLMDWPQRVPKPRVGIVRDWDENPWWTRFARFLKTNGFDFGLFNLHVSTWLEDARHYQLIVGVPSCLAFHLEEVRRKYYVLERHMGIACYPSFEECLLYEDKVLEAYLSGIYAFPFVSTFVTHDLREAFASIPSLPFPLVSKITPSSGSVGVELVKTAGACRRMFKRAFSPGGRLTHARYLRQKNYVYLQPFEKNDGYDLRIIVVGNVVSGYYRRVPDGDFRASGMHLQEQRPLPPEAMKLARAMNQRLRFPMLVVDMLRTEGGAYRVTEISPKCGVEPGDDAEVDGQAGHYVFESEDEYHFQPGRVWVQELVLREVLRRRFLSA